MPELLTYVELGARHVTDLRGADHVLFLLVLGVPYHAAEWRRLLWIVMAFTAGHSATFALAVTGALVPPAGVIEFLIPVTIIATAVENIVVRESNSSRRSRHRLTLAALFGLVHGAGFANYLRSMFVEDLAVPLLGFNAGIELGQIIVLLSAFAAFSTIDRVIEWQRRFEPFGSPVRLRSLAVSLVVMVVGTRWAVERIPW